MMLILFFVFETLSFVQCFDAKKEFLELKMEMRRELQTLKEAVAKCQAGQDLLRTSRLLLPFTNDSNGIVAFYAYMSHSETNPSLHHQFKFDVVKTNIGGGYNPYSGTFTAPTPGVYVFSWTIFTGDHGAVIFDLMVNGQIYGSGYGETNDVSHDFDSDSGTIVLSLYQGDSVYIETSHATSGTILGERNAKTSFAGWKI